MAVVEVKVGTRNFQLACENGQESHLSGLAEEIDKKLHELAKQMRTSNESLLLLMTALMMQDELNEFNAKLDGEGGVSLEAFKQGSDEEMTDMVNTVSNYLENMLGKIETSKKAA